MAKATSIKGKDLMLFTSGKAIALATEHALSVSRDTIDSKTKDDGDWSSLEAGAISWETSSSALYAAEADNQETMDSLFDAMLAGTAVDVVFGVPTNKGGDLPEAGWAAPTSGMYEGKAIVTALNLNANNGDKASYSVSLQGIGKLTRK